MKKLIIMAASLLFAVGALAQNLLPNDPAVKTGKLDNGITYYIRHNALPEGRAEFYLATHVGAIQETPDQDGLAHFLEHMCFNGLKNLPGKQMLDYLQHIGAEFGRNINAGTGVEQTTYMLNNMPVSREGIIDTCLLVMHDYSHFVINDPKEIDAERGVILEEKRTRNTAGWRMFEQSLPYLYGDSKYATCTLIGSEENLKNFKPESLKSFYETWYRPDMQAIIVVGDIDVEQIYNKIVKLFADIPAPEQPTVRINPAVAVNDETVVGILKDPENTATKVDFIWKLGEPTPVKMRGTDMGYMERMLKKIAEYVMNERLQDIYTKADAPFLQAYMGFEDISETCETIAGTVVCDNAKTEAAIAAMLTEVEKIKRFGFTDDEISRAKEDILKAKKDKVAGESTRKNPEFINSYLSHFFDGISYLTPEMDLQISQALCTQISSDMINKMIPQIVTGEHLSIIYKGIDKEGMVHPTAEQILGIVSAVKAAEIAAPAAENINKDFLAGRKIKAGKVKKETAGLYGSTEWTLSNGLKVVVLPTEYKKDQVIFNLQKKGGRNLIPTEDLASFDNTIVETFKQNCGVADYSVSTVGKMLTGKTVRVNPYISGIHNGVNGSSTPEDFETALQIMNLLITAPRFDQEEWNVALGQLQSVIPNMVNTPNYKLQQKMYEVLYGNNPRATIISEETLKNASLDTFKKYYQMLFKDIAGATLYIVGNVKTADIKPLIEKYCASLPKGKKAPALIEENFVKFAQGEKSEVFKTKMATPKVTVLQAFNVNNEYSLTKDASYTAASFILDMIYVQTLREEEGGTYGASAMFDTDFEPYNRTIAEIYFDTNVQQQESLRALAVKGIKGLAEEGPTDEQMTRAVENAKKQLPEKRITNGYWMGALQNSAKLGIDTDAENEKAIAALSAESVKTAVAEVISAGNFLEVVMLPEEE